MNLLSRISIKELVKKCKELKIKEYGSKQVILTHKKFGYEKSRRVQC